MKLPGGPIEAWHTAGIKAMVMERDLKERLAGILAGGTPSLAQFNMPAMCDYLRAQGEIARRRRWAMGAMALGLCVSFALSWCGRRGTPAYGSAADAINNIVLVLSGTLALLGFVAYIHTDIRLVAQDRLLAGIVDNQTHFAAARRYARRLRLRVYLGFAAACVVD